MRLSPPLVRSLGTLPVPPRPSSRFPNEAFEDSARDSRLLIEMRAINAKREAAAVLGFDSKLEAEAVNQSQGLRESSGDWDFPFIKDREQVENDVVPKDIQERVRSSEKVREPPVGTVRNAIDAADADWLIRERHLLRGQHFD